MTSAEIALVCGLTVQVGCQDRLYVNLGADETLACFLTGKQIYSCGKFIVIFSKLT